MEFLLQFCDLVTAFLLIYGLKRMSSPATASSGIVLAGIGMLVVTLASFLYVFGVGGEARAHLPVNLLLAGLALLLGVGWSWWRGERVPLTAMPQMVALYNGMGGAAAAAIAGIELLAHPDVSNVRLAIAIAGGFIGSFSFSGSLIAWAKLEGRLRKPWRPRFLQLGNGLVLLVAVASGTAMPALLPNPDLLLLFFSFSLLFGALITLPIGGADMPVVISLCNACTGIAVGFEGFVLNHPALMIAGTVVGAAGSLLTLLMARAMNRSLGNILFSNFGDAGQEASQVTGQLKPISTEDAAATLCYARKVIFVPGYGLAAAHAQQKLYELAKRLQEEGADVKFAIHPVAGRMPGHMDVLLAEAGVPYEMIVGLEEINEEFPATDVALVVGANDIINPAARTEKGSPIYGMPILDVDKARQVYVIKRGQGKGYAGVENPLFLADNCRMVYGDAQQVLIQMLQSIKELVGQH
ncbi:NAD(P)(+) transhydrogenase (Re/Si-specific) subunit beta [Methylacidimicrobium sp. B4]|uniref:NAD(P)(+) transhydrogenase (Re/Si-specific) subunit beta n=1 Tax=Methylacidimicrobium sp. B4 TaxID=2796139 RepID=UPI001A8D7809|nr:NAD(P)(+) transhydrogenase (Re/Si-specific) subunit beta [Methylacidimicrobium sp. B4]QSR84376.1 NAD(P)(+) transhydrogenase (Re/Si-specific) subunit beta [Methylacidimicrobium sp. B4]